jgi:hypothetical protein
MEMVLEVYCWTPDPSHPIVCMDETRIHCIREVRAPIPAKAGQSERYDVEYERNGVAHLMAFYAPFENWRRVEVADNHAAAQWAEGVRRWVQEDYPPAIARALLDKLEFVYPPKHGSWLNRAECEFSVLSRQCLDRRLPDIETVTSEVQAWTTQRNQSNKPVDWRFTTGEARIKLKRLYPKLSD